MLWYAFDADLDGLVTKDEWDGEWRKVKMSATTPPPTTPPPVDHSKKQRKVQEALRWFGNWVKMRFGSVDKGFKAVSVNGRQSYDQFTAMVSQWPDRPKGITVRDLWKGVDTDHTDYVTASEWTYALEGP